MPTNLPCHESDAALRELFARRIALLDGAMGTTSVTVLGYGTVTAGNLAGGLNAVAPLTGSGAVTADGSMVINGVAAMHSELLEHTVLKDFHDMWPEKFPNHCDQWTRTSHSGPV